MGATFFAQLLYHVIESNTSSKISVKCINILYKLDLNKE